MNGHTYKRSEQQPFFGESNSPHDSDDERLVTTKVSHIRSIIGNKFCSLFLSRTKLKYSMQVLLFILYSLLIIYIYHSSVQPRFDSKLMNSDYACHDTISCELRANLKTVSEQREERLSNQQQYTNYARQVFFSALYTENYVLGALILGYSIRKYHPNHLMYMMYLDDKIKNNTLMALKEVGWLVLPVARIEPPLKGTHKRFIDQFTKLTLWSFTQYDSIIYLDSDTVVMNDISHLHHLVSNPFRTGFEFAAATDNWFGTYIYKFNAGVIVLHPSKLVYNELMRVYNIPDNYNPIMAEQEFLNQYFRLRYLELPTIYNMNMAVYSSYKNLWYKLRPDFKVVHYTIFKPFLGKYQRGYDGPYELYKEIWQDFTSHVDINRIKTKWNLRW